MKLLYQKVYFKADEWKELLSFIHSISSEISVSLLSKNVVDMSLKKIKDILLGECVLLYVNTSDITSIYTYINKIQLKYSSRLFLIGFLITEFDTMYFLKLEQLRNYNEFYIYKKKNILNTMFTINQFVLFEFCKFLKYNNSFSQLRMSFFINQANVIKSNLVFFY